MFINDWSESGLEGMMSDFEINAETLEGVEVLLASYAYECYEGDAFVLFRKNGELFRVEAGHCSCYGLEGQWSPEATTVAALRLALGKGELGRDSYNPFREELAEVLDGLEAQPTT